MTHGTFAVLDRERNLPAVPGRKNRDFSIWDFGPVGGKFYTIFPYFHLAGFLSIVINPLITEASSPVLGPALMPPSAALMRDVMRDQKLRAVYVPPSIAEQVLQAPGGLDLFRGLDFLCYTGGPFSQKAGEQLAQVTELLPLYGSTEAFQVPQLAPLDPKKDYAYMEWNPVFKAEMQPSDDEPGAFELVLFADASTEKMSALNHNLPGVSLWRTKDLFKKHPDPSKSSLWSYYGRRDDIIVLSNGEKFNPVPMELLIQGHPLLAGAIIIGMGRPQPALLVEPNHDVPTRETLLDKILPLVEQANAVAPTQGRVVRSKILIASPEKPFTRAGKGTIVRKMTEKSYADELQALYEYSDRGGKASTSSKPKATLRPSFPLQSVKAFVFDAVNVALPSTTNFSEHDNLFMHGLDSLKSADLCEVLRSGMRDILASCDPSWLTVQIIYEYPDMARLSTVIYDFMNSGKRPQTHAIHDKDDRANEIEAMIDKFTDGLPSQRASGKYDLGSEYTIALTGSTGALGTALLHRFIEDPHISKIICLNRSPDAQSRQAKEISDHLGATNQDLNKVSYMTIDVGAPHLALSDEDYDNLVKHVEIIVHNAWTVDFLQPLKSFEPQIQGIWSLIELSLNGRHCPRILFISSIASVRNWPKTTGKSLIPESVPLDGFPVPLQIGYAESKYVAERILCEASQRSRVPVSILRVGQIGGSTAESDNRSLRAEWLVSLIATSTTLGKFPTNVTPVDWIPINKLAEEAHEIMCSKEHSTEARVFNLVNPKPLPWIALMEILVKCFDMKAEPVSLSHWVEEIRRGPDITSAAGFLPFFDAIGEDFNAVYSTENSARASKTFRDMESVSEEWLVGWLKELGFQKDNQ